MSSCLGIEGLDSSSICLHPSVTGSVGTSLCRVTVRRPFLTTFRGMSLGCCISGRPFNLMRLPCIFFSIWFVFSFESSILTLCDFFCSYFTVKDCLELESRFEERVHVVIEYTSTINDFDDLVDPRTLAHHYLGLEPSHYVLRAIRREEKSKLF